MDNITNNLNININFILNKSDKIEYYIKMKIYNFTVFQVLKVFLKWITQFNLI